MAGLWRLAPFLRPYRGRIALASACLLAAALVTLAIPATLRVVVDSTVDALRSSDGALDAASQLGSIRAAFLGLAAICAAAALLSAARHVLVSWIGERVVTDLRAAVYQSVLLQSPDFLESVRVGEVLSRLSSDTAVVQSIVGSSLSMGLRHLVLVAGATLYLASVRPVLVLAMLLVVLLFVLPMVRIGRRVRRLSRESQDRLAETNALAGEVIPALDVVQAYGQRAREDRRFREFSELAFASAIRRSYARGAMTAVAMVSLLLANLYGMYLGVMAVLAGSLSAGTLGQIAMLMAMIASSASVLAEVWGDMVRATGATERLIELLDTPTAQTLSDESASHAALSLRAAPAQATTPAQVAKPAQATKPAQAAIDAVPGLPIVHRAPVALRFVDVRFAYPSRPKHAVLDGLHLSVAAGSTLALVGPSGAGKSTLFSLLLRFRAPQEGRILIDDVPIDSKSTPALLELIAYVPQQPTVFSGSITDNIRYGMPTAPTSRVLDAARRACAMEFVERLPRGLDTEVGERGMQLSGGQRQRIALARALLLDRPLLLLDEATSSLDAHSETQIQHALDAARVGRTTLVIAHRLATVRNADAIAVMSRGRIVEHGRHEELIRAGGLYSRLANLQFTEAVPDDASSQR